MATLRSKLKRIEPAYFAGDLMAVIKGILNTFAVHLEYDVANMDYIIIKVEPWNAYEHLNGDYSMIYQVAERDEMGAYNKMRKYIDRLKEEAEL
jgi:hypothetical protein